jgi:Fe(3+) dicitrate transport protein
VTAYRNDFERNWYKLQSVVGSGISAILSDPEANALALSFLKGAESPDDAIVKRANNRSYYSQGLQGRVEWDLRLQRTDVALTAGFRLHEDEEDRFQHEDGYRMADGELILTSAGAPGSQANRVSDAEVQSFFVASEIRAGDWTLTPGIRHESIELRRLDFSTSDPARSDGPTRVRRNSVSVTIPGIGALYRLSPAWRLLAGVHKGFNPPGPGSSAEEESSRNIEAGVRYAAGGLNFESIYFVNDYDNLVGTVTNSTGGGGEIGDQFDGGEATVAGLELTAGYALNLDRLSVPLSLQYTWTREYEFETGFESSFEPWGDVSPGDELPYVPEHQLRVATGLVAERWRVSLGANYVGSMRTTAGQGPIPDSERIDSRVVWDAFASWNFSDSFSAYLKVENVLDETYVASRRPAGLRPGLPQTAYFGLTYRL